MALNFNPAGKRTILSIDGGGIVPVKRLMPPFAAHSSTLSTVTFWAAPDWLQMRLTPCPPPNGASTPASWRSSPGS